MSIKYLMVTSFNNHWDCIYQNKTSYTLPMLKSGMQIKNITDNNETLFIKIEKDTKKFEKAWIGKIKCDSQTNFKISFNVIIETEIFNCPDKYKHYSEGWYLENWIIDVDQVRDKQVVSELNPPFFKNLKIGDYKIFEDDTYKLLKILGIHDIFKFDKQKGIADGFFKLNKLAVIYDNTLMKDFEEEKKYQIKNFYYQINENRFTYDKKTLNFKGCRKQIWIITRKKSGLIEKQDDVEIKEISIYDLINIYEQRINKNYDLDELENELAKI